MSWNHLKLCTNKRIVYFHEKKIIFSHSKDILAILKGPKFGITLVSGVKLGYWDDVSKPNRHIFMRKWFLGTQNTFSQFSKFHLWLLWHYHSIWGQFR